MTPVLATTIDEKTVQALTPSTLFKTNSKVYVTFHLNPQGKPGAACILWYLNNKVIGDVTTIPVKATSSVAYGYTIYDEAGTGSVDLSWSSNGTCSDKQLAQQLPFTIQP